MPKRVCDICGKNKDLKGGVTCANGHFICSNCKYVSGWVFKEVRRKCPICDKSLR